VKDERKTKKQLIAELEEIRQQRSVEEACERIREEVLLMHSGDDLMKVNAVLYHEMIKLGVEIKACGIYFIDEESDRWMGYTAFETPHLHGISWTSPTLKELDSGVVVGLWEHSASMAPEQVEGWRQGQAWSQPRNPETAREIGQLVKKQYGLSCVLPFHAPELVMFDTQVSFKYGIIWMLSQEVSDAYVSMAQGFAEPLSLAYTRYLDLQAAEERNRRLALERAVERVRAEAMAMRQSDDLLKVVVVVHQEMEQLGIEAKGCNIAFIDEENNQLNNYNTYTHPLFMELPDFDIVDGSRTVNITRTSLDNETWESAVSAWREKRVYTFTRSYTADFLHDYLTKKGFKGNLSKYDLSFFMGEYHITNVPFEYGLVGFHERSFKESSVAIVQELAEALSLGYLRFLDFQRLEQQNRKLEVEQALEQVRTQVAGMQESQDLFKVRSLIRVHLRELGVPCQTVGINLYDHTSGVVRRFAGGTSSSGPPYEVPIQTHKAGWTHWQNGRTWSRYFSQEDSNQWQRRMVEQGIYSQEEAREGMAWVPLEGLWIVDVPFTQGTLAINRRGSEPFSDDQVSLLEHFTEVFALAYSRFEDLKAAEERARSAEREQAAERVRAEAMAMRSTDDLRNVVMAMYRGIAGPMEEDSRIICAVYLIDEDEEEIIAYYAETNPARFGEIVPRMWRDLEEIDHRVAFRHYRASFDTWFSKAGTEELERWRLGEPWSSQIVRGDDSPEDIPAAYKGEFTITNVPFEHGMVTIRKRATSEDEIEFIKQLTDAFLLGYVRYVDFERLDEAQRRLIDELEEELQAAHDMQMRLMPTESPQIEAFDIAGSCIPTNHVGGDFFQYFPQNSKLSISLADVTGHAMEAAVPVMMFSGILKSQMEIGGSVEEIFGRLNRSLHGTLDKRTFVCFAMGELDTETRTFHLANGGCPYPYHFQASTGEISELQLDAYPLAIRPDSEYQTMDIQLDAGDRIIFCSDGIIEAENTEGEIYGFEHTAETIRQGCSEDLPAEALIDHLIGAVQEFAGETPQGDDMTCVVLRVEG